MSVDAQFGGLHFPQEVCTDGLDLLAVGAPLIELEQLLRLTAAGLHVNIRVHYDVGTVDLPILPVAGDVGQLLIAVGLLVQRLLHQFP